MNNKRQIGSTKKFKYPKKRCKFCTNSIKIPIYSDIDILKKFINEYGKIIPASSNGNCPKHQRMIARLIKIARILAFLPFVKD